MVSALLICTLIVVCFSGVFASGKYTYCGYKPFVKINPPTLFPAGEVGYSQIVVHTGTRIAHIAGQTALDASFEAQGDTLSDQLPEAANNVELALKAIDATRKDVISMTIYTVGFTEDEHLETIKWIGMTFGSPAITLVDVKNLAMEGLFVEIEAKAVVSDNFCGKMKKWKCDGNRVVFGKMHY